MAIESGGNRAIAKIKEVVIAEDYRLFREGLRAMLESRDDLAKPTSVRTGVV